MAKYDRLTPEMRQMLPQLFLHGLAPGDFDQTSGWLRGEEAPLSTNSILRLKTQWEQEYRQWKEQPLEADYLYVRADDIYPQGGTVDETLALLVVLGVDRMGAQETVSLRGRLSRE